MVKLPFFRPRAAAPEVNTIAVARRVESDRMRTAAAQRTAQERARAIQVAMQLGRVSEPMTPRELIAAEVAEKRQRQKSRSS